MKIKNKKSWYAILVTLMIIGFLIVLTTWILNLVLRDMNDNIGEARYLQAYSAAEWAMELALLKIKQNWYWVYDKLEIDEDTDNDSKILRINKDDQREVLISYDLNSKTNYYSWSLDSFKQVVIPLFYTDISWEEYNISDITLNSNNNENIAWNIISLTWDWIWWVWSIDTSTEWEWKKSDWSFLKQTINFNNWFLDDNTKNYLVVINLDPSNVLDYELESTGKFTKPISKIISSAKIMNYKQNLETTLDNTEFLSILKYSIYSK